MKTIETLKTECEEKFGRSLQSPSDFNAFNIALQKATHRDVSISSLKRIWGYIKYPFKPSNEIRSILAAYCGYKDWYSYSHSDEISDISDFLSKNIVKSENLSKGALIIIKWEPNRTCELLYLGDSRYMVSRAENSKLINGDIFSASIIVGGEPLICKDILRNGDVLAEAYVAGKTDGIRIVNIEEGSN